MTDTLFEEEEFDGIDFKVAGFSKGKYDYCTFVSCALADLDISNTIFIECRFQDCDLSLSKILETSFRSCEFIDCKLLGLQFDQCNSFLFTATFERCRLNNSVFYQVDCKALKFKACKLIEVDFTEADLCGVVLNDCDLEGAIFDQSNLSTTDFRNAHNYRLDPESNRIKKARFSSSGLTGLLDRYDIIID